MMSHAPKSDRYFWLDWIRFCSALAVLLCHVRGHHFVNYEALPMGDQGFVTAAAFGATRLGHEAVILFFVLSGYLVGGRSLHRVLKGTYDLKRYVLDRATRIYVPLIPALGIAGLVLSQRGESVEWLGLLVNLAGLQGAVPGFGAYGGNAPLWSLAFEIWFYVLWGGVLAGLSAVSLRAKLATWGAVVASLAVLLRLGAPEYFFCWLLGVWAHQLPAKQHRGALLTIGLLASILGICFMQLNFRTAGDGLARWRVVVPPASISVLVLGCGCALIIHAVAFWRPTSGVVQTIERWGVPCAAFSYSLYLTHYVFLGWWTYHFPDRAPVITLAAIAGLTLKVLGLMLAGWLSYLCFERHTDRIRWWLLGDSSVNSVDRPRN